MRFANISMDGKSDKGREMVEGREWCEWLFIQRSRTHFVRTRREASIVKDGL